MQDSKPSKSALKREHLALQKLGEELLALNDLDLEPMNLDETLLDALRAARSMRSHGALRRQKQLIGKLMRDADVEAIRSVLQLRATDELGTKRVFTMAERWRDRLIADGPGALDALLAETGLADNELRELLVELEQTIDQRREKTLRRQVFRRIHALLSGDA